MLLKDATTKFLSHCRHGRNLSENTLRAYTIDLDQFKRYADADRIIHTCDKEIIRGYLKHLFESQALKESSIKRRIGCLKAMFGWLEDEMTITHNPFYRFSLNIKIPSRLPKALSRKEIKLLINTPLKKLGIINRKAYNTDNLLSSSSTRQGYIQLTTLVSLEILFATGVRVGELTQILISDINLSDRVIKINGKGNKERQVYLPDNEICALIRTYIKARSVFTPTTKILLTTTRGEAVTTQMVRLNIRKTSESAKFDHRVTPHMLRHSTATHLLIAGLDIRYVQRLLGHQSITTTQIYTHISDSQLKLAVSKTHPLGKIMSK